MTEFVQEFLNLTDLGERSEINNIKYIYTRQIKKKLSIEITCSALLLWVEKSKLLPTLGKTAAGWQIVLDLIVKRLNFSSWHSEDYR